MILTNEDKKIILILVIVIVISISVSVYLTLNKSDKYIKQNKSVYILHINGEIEDTFEAKYTKNKNTLPVINIDHTMMKNSSEILPVDWNIIAKAIGNVYNKYDAFIIICSRDTLVYTASALSFMLENLSKPVVLTDGNVYNALESVMNTVASEVMVTSENKLIRGTRSIASSNTDFSSPNYPIITASTCMPKSKDPLKILFINPKIKVMVIKCYPGMDNKYLKSLELNKMNAIVIETYGSGSIPINDEIINTFNTLVEKGIIIVSVSQTNILSSIPETDIRLIEAGVLNGMDMTTSAAYAKLHYLLANVQDIKLIGQIMEMNLRGEIYDVPTINK